MRTPKKPDQQQQQLDVSSPHLQGPVLFGADSSVQWEQCRKHFKWHLMWGYQMEGPGIDDIQPVPRPPAPATWEPGNFTPGPLGRCELRAGGWYLNRLYSQSCLADALQGLGEFLQRFHWPLMGSQSHSQPRDLIAASPFVTLLSHHFHTFLSDAGHELRGWGVIFDTVVEVSGVGPGNTRWWPDILMTPGDPEDVGASAVSPAIRPKSQ